MLPPRGLLARAGGKGTNIHVYIVDPSLVISHPTQGLTYVEVCVLLKALDSINHIAVCVQVFLSLGWCLLFQCFGGSEVVRYFTVAAKMIRNLTLLTLFGLQNMISFHSVHKICRLALQHLPGKVSAYFLRTSTLTLFHALCNSIKRVILNLQ